MDTSSDSSSIQLRACEGIAPPEAPADAEVAFPTPLAFGSLRASLALTASRAQRSSMKVSL
jgi:hypothetical protein